MRLQDLEGKIGEVRLVFETTFSPKIVDLKTGEVTPFFFPNKVFVSIHFPEGVYAEDIPLDISSGLPELDDKIFIGEFISSYGYFRWRKV